ncbi:MAG: hypothetical protein VB021_03525 [Oscillospiraceae bacterium]|nr:hypothetical protein [Oscillospiraceae bacterium]
MRKSLLPLILSLAILFTACGAAQNAPGADAAADPSAQDASADAPAGTAPVFALTGRIEQQVIFEQDGVSVTALSLEAAQREGSDGVNSGVLTLNVHVENRSSRELLVKPFEFTVNGITTYGYDPAGYAAAGYSGDGYFILGYTDNPPEWFKFHTLPALGITDVAEVRFEMVLIDAESGETYSHAPVRIRTDLAASDTAPQAEAAEIVYDGNGLRIACLGLTDDVAYPGEKAARIRLLMENNTEQIIAVTLFGENGFDADVTVNGTAYRMDRASLTTFPSPLYEILPGAALYTDIYIGRDDFAQFGLASVFDIRSFSCRFQVNAADFRYNEENLFITPDVHFAF